MNAGSRFWHRLDDGRVRCDVCPRGCSLREGQRGFCYVRACEGGEVVLTSYGRSSGFCVDPIEKKPLYHFLPGTAVLSFGTAGCNLACRFCQNWELSHARETDVLCDAATPDAIAREAVRLGCRSVAFTYTDPVIFLEYAVDTALACRSRGVRSVAVTAGYVEPEARAELFGAIDAANVDLKSFSEEFYAQLTGAHLEPVLDTLRWIVHETAVWLELTTLLIPGHNDSDAEIEELSRWVATELGPHVPLHLSAFHPAGRMLALPATPYESLARARRIAQRSGLRHVYTGNVLDREGGSTWCSGCGALLVGREVYELTAWHLGPDGACEECGQPCPGVFEDQPGRWGNRRLPVRLRR